MDTDTVVTPASEPAVSETPTSTASTASPAPAVRHWAVPALDVFEREGDLRLVLSVPGVSLDRLTVEVEGGALTVAGARGDRPGHGWRRTLRLPDHVDATRVTAALRDGVLTLDLPRAEASKARRIEVRSA